MNELGLKKMEALSVGSKVADDLLVACGGNVSDDRYIQLAERLCYLLNRIPECETEDDVKVLCGKMSALVGEVERMKGL